MSVHQESNDDARQLRSGGDLQCGGGLLGGAGVGPDGTAAAKVRGLPQLGSAAGRVPELLPRDQLVDARGPQHAAQHLQSTFLGSRPRGFGVLGFKGTRGQGPRYLHVRQIPTAQGG